MVTKMCEVLRLNRNRCDRRSPWLLTGAALILLLVSAALSLNAQVPGAQYAGRAIQEIEYIGLETLFDESMNFYLDLEVRSAPGRTGSVNPCPARNSCWRIGRPEGSEESTFRPRSARRIPGSEAPRRTECGSYSRETRYVPLSGPGGP